MEPANWNRVRKIFVDVVGQKPDERSDFLNDACGGDSEIRREVESLLSSYKDADSFLETPAAVEFEKTELAAGQTIGHYRVIEQIGSGGMGNVYLAKDGKLDRKVAIKILDEKFSSDESSLQRFINEAKAASGLNHPNILVIHEVGETDELQYIVSEYVEGKTLRALIEENSLNLTKILDISIQIASALSTAHESKLVHRDIKPENIMVRSDGVVKILDFGLAKLIEQQCVSQIGFEDETIKQNQTAKGVILGTVNYMSPEQAKGKKVDERTDIFSFGVVLYEMITGQNPFAAETTNETIAAILKSGPKPISVYVPNVSSKLEAIVNKCLRKDKSKRYQNAKALLSDLKELELEAKLEQSASPNLVKFNENEGEKTAIIKEQDSVKQIATTAEQRNISSAGYIPQSVKQNKFAVFGILATLIVSAIALSFYIYSNATTTSALTDKDVILLTDFENKTGEDIFDGTLKQGLWIQLRQSPFLSIFPDEQTRNTLKLMKRSKDERITRELAREICQRQGLKAYVGGTIAKFGTAYALTLEAVNSVSAETFAITQVEAENKEKILQALSQASTEMRKKLGESLVTIERFDKPLEATTNSFEALKAYSDAVDLIASGKENESLPYFKRAIELDRKFAMAYLRISGNYISLAKYKLADVALRNAFELREHASERERVLIESSYYASIHRDINKSKEILEIAKRNYPRDGAIRAFLASYYLKLGKFDTALTEYRELTRIMNEIISADLNFQSNGISVNPNVQMGVIKIFQGETGKAKEFFDKSGIRNSNLCLGWLFAIAFVEENEKELNEILRLNENRDGECNNLLLRTGTEIVKGKWKSAERFVKKAVALEQKKNNKEKATLYSVAYVSRATVFGDCSKTKILENSPVDYYVNVFPSTFSPLGLARCGKFAEAERQINKLREKYPNGTLENGLWIPMFKAQIELEKGNAKKAVEIMENAREYEWAFGSWLQPQYILAEAYLKSGENRKAKAEFQKILDMRGKGSLSHPYPLALLGKARATKDKREYEKFFEWWKDADEDLEILIEAKKEYENLN